MKIDVDPEVLASYHGNVLMFGESSEYYCNGLLKALGPLKQSGNDSVYERIEESVKSIVNKIKGMDNQLMSIAKQIKIYYDFVQRMDTLVKKKRS